MKNIALKIALILSLVGIIGFVGLQPLHPPKEYLSLEYNRLENSSPENAPANNPNVRDPHKKYGWGFVRSKEEQPPYVPQWQQDLLKEYNAIYKGSGAQKVLAITFDMGYELEGATPRILDVLKKHDAKAAFFLTGHWVKTQPDLLKRMIAEGHDIGNHTWNHPSLPDLSQDKLTEEIMSLHRDIQQASGCDYAAKYLRPPKGEFSRSSLDATKSLGYQTIFWSISSVDWLPSSSPRKVYNDVLSQLHPGAIILLHGNSKAVVDQMEDMMTAIKERGYSIVPLTEIQKQ
ncbi:polysaccharide deacetylase family protein [Heliobacterium chlorum]|uniref:Polysaccharide deacetylase family protein n=1 Tax=Heliobacterium chlorum TaxID=2698 RepID=A0ABR7SZW8_HELCL|nr:polysaccharide deacetylase family protein [Heliobacterium chlorum]MBC9783382.1 polysaccharide deacetylase family protein [Heliobacterium chlorum]